MEQQPTSHQNISESSSDPFERKPYKLRSTWEYFKDEIKSDIELFSWAKDNPQEYFTLLSEEVSEKLQNLKDKSAEVTEIFRRKP